MRVLRRVGPYCIGQEGKWKRKTKQNPKNPYHPLVTVATPLGSSLELNEDRRVQLSFAPRAHHLLVLDRGPRHAASKAETKTYTRRIDSSTIGASISELVLPTASTQCCGIEFSGYDQWSSSIAPIGSSADYRTGRRGGHPESHRS